MTARRGYSLIETLAAMALVSVAFTTTGVALHGMFRTAQRMQDGLELQRTWERFAVRFRADVHEALSAQEGPGERQAHSKPLSLVLPGNATARYTLQPGRIDRVFRRGGEVRHRDTYRLAKGVVPRWHLQGERRIAIASLILDPQPAGTASPPALPILRVDAAVGLLRPQSPPSQ